MADGCNLYVTDSDFEQIEDSVLNELSERENYAEVEKRIAEANKTMPEGKMRTEFGKDFGTFAHERFQHEIREQELSQDRIEVTKDMDPSEGDFAIEYTITHPDGSKYRYDYIDFKDHIIIDWKPQDPSKSDVDLAKEWIDKMNKYAEAYAEKFGHIPEVYLKTYPSTKSSFTKSTTETKRDSGQVKIIKEKWNYSDKKGNKIAYRSDVFSKGPNSETHKHSWYEIGDRGLQDGSKVRPNRASPRDGDKEEK